MRRENSTHDAALPIALLPYPVLEIDDRGVIVASNGALERELHVGGDALAGRQLADCVDDDARERVHELLKAGASSPDVVRLAFRDGDAQVARTFHVVRDARGTWLIGEPAERDEGRDASARARERAEAQADEYARVSQELAAANEQLAQRAEALTEATETKSRFLATMSHELRTPLNAVLGYAGLLRDGVYGTVSEPQKRAVQSIVRRAKDLQLLIDDVLDLSKIEAGRMELRVDEFDPTDVLNEVKDAIAPFGREKGLAIVVRTQIERHVRLDRAKYRQVILNLASNAVKFTPAGGEVRLSVESDGDASFITKVSDTGIGIAPEDLGRIFDNFQQVDSGPTRRFPGIGLGLAIVRRMVELLSGTITVESEQGHGTTFVIQLPVRPEPTAVLGETGEIPDDAQLSGDPVVLAIDDDPEVIALLRDSLAPAHFRVVGALNGDRGMELARILQPLAITLDIMMPEKDGWHVLRELKADPELCRIPVIIMSIVSERSLGFSLGVTDYLVKPVDRRVLIDVLERLRRRPTVRSAVVVDDDYDARTLMSDLLRSLGLEVRGCENAAGCLRLLEAQLPDVLFLDVTMPDEEVARILDAIAHDRRLESMRTVVVTRSDAAGREACVPAATPAVTYGVQQHPDELLRELRNALAMLGDRDAALGARHSADVIQS